MSVLVFSETVYKDLRTTIVTEALGNQQFRTELSKALLSIRDHEEALSIGEIAERVKAFSQGLWRANRIAYAYKRSTEYEGTPPLPNGGTARPIRWALTTLDDIDYNTRCALPVRRENRFDLNGWGGAPETSFRLFHRVSLAVAEQHSRTAAYETA